MLMKKALIFFIIGLVVLVGVIFIIEKSKKQPETNLPVAEKGSEVKVSKVDVSNVCVFFPKELIEKAIGREIVKVEEFGIKKDTCFYYTSYSENFHYDSPGGPEIVVSYSEDPKEFEKNKKLQEDMGYVYQPDPSIGTDNYVVINNRGEKSALLFLILGKGKYLMVKSVYNAATGEELVKIAKVLAEKIQSVKKTTNEIEKKEAPIQESAGEKTLGEVLSRGTNVSSVKYDMIASQPGKPSMTQKVWFKKDRMRTEMTTGGQTIIIIANITRGIIYQYLPAQNMAMKMQSDKTPESSESPIEIIKGIEKYNPKIVGIEKIDGKDCLVVEYNAEGTNIKSWIWKEKGFPLKMEISTSSGTITTEFKNIEFVDIPDNMFELPAGVKIITP